MNSCKEVRKLIDQAEKPDMLAFEVTEHIERCSDCERFSSERAGLRKLLASPARVSQPEKRIRRREVAPGKRIAPPVVLAADDGGVVIVRGQNGEMDIQMPTVSVGAQPLLLVGAGRRVTPSGGTSF